jgi:dUTP pyrophosphatase
MNELNDLKVKFANKYGLNQDIVDDVLEIINIQQQKFIQENYIKFIYTDDEYGEMAKELHRTMGGLRRSYDGDAGIDLPVILSKEEQNHGSKKIWPGEREMLQTGLIMEFPVGYYGRIIHRSSTEKVSRLRVVEGIIDDFRGPLFVQVHNQNTTSVDVYHGTRLGQLILSKTCPFQVVEANELRPSARGSNGFGSSGK